MVILGLWILFFTLFETLNRANGATHWVVTENGMIQSHVGSPLDLRRPYDLISLLEQEKRWNEIQTVLQDLMSRKTVIEEKWTSLQGNSAGMDQKMALKNSDCLVDGKLLNTINMYSNIATNGSERVNIQLSSSEEQNSDDHEDHEDRRQQKSGDEMKNYQVPDCAKFTHRVEFSSANYQHFPTLYNSETEVLNVTLASPDDSLEKLMPVRSVQLFGHEIHKELEKNTTSWVHYNLGALYWRIKGNGPKAVECSRRAIYFVTPDYRDIAFHNLAGILHKAKQSKEAALLLHTAIEYAPKQSLHYLALGNVYSALGDYNTSVMYYDMFLKLKPDHSGAQAIRKATLCFSKLETHLIDFQENVLGYLQGILSDLHDFHSLQQHWLRLSKRLMWEHSSYDEELGSSHEDTLEAIFGSKRNQHCVQQKNADNSRPVISCDFVRNPVSDFDTLNLQNLFQYVETETEKINERMMTRTGRGAKGSSSSDRQQKKSDKQHGNSGDGDRDVPPQTYPKFPTTMSTSSHMYFDVTGWPKEEECNRWNLPVDEKQDLKLPVFLPPENKAYDITKFLTESIDVPNDVEHKLPWYPPNCDESNAFGDKYVQPSDRNLLTNEIKSNGFLKNHFLKYVNNGKADEAEIGQRIITAMEKKSAPTWILSTLASLYWRTRGHTKKALDCLDLAFQRAPKEQSDMILVSIASIVHQLGLVNQALKYANLAFKLNYVEPSTNFLLALLHYDTNPLLAMYYMKNVLRVDQEYYEGQAERLLKIWGCRIKLGAFNSVKKMPTERGTSPVASPQDICTDKESAAFKSQGVICSANGDECKTASIQCYHTKTYEDSAASTTSGIGASHAAQQPEPDQSQLERIGAGNDLNNIVNNHKKSHQQSQEQHQQQQQRPFHMRIYFGEDHTATVALSDDPVPEALLQVYDKSGTYPLSAQSCRKIIQSDWVHFSSMWQSMATRNIDIAPFLKPLTTRTSSSSSSSSGKKDHLIKPYCADVTISPSSYLDHLTRTILRNKLPNSPDKSLIEWLSTMAGGDHKALVEEIGAKIGYALQQNATSWVLATAGALYWRIMGNSEEAIICLRLALSYVPDDMRDVALNSLANVLHRVGFNGDALEVAYMALRSHPNFSLNYFTVGNILTSLGDLEEAISFYRTSLALDGSFEPARNRLQAILCTLLFDESGSLRSGSSTQSSSPQSTPPDDDDVKDDDN